MRYAVRTLCREGEHGRIMNRKVLQKEWAFVLFAALLSAAALRESGAGHLQILLDFGAEGMVRSEGAYNAAPLDPAGDA